ncbi:MAG: crossover junction endodeoxyribonuclease RuvC [Anaerolineae bacterium]|nr:crossover junction endodeoxyribonuclease RuvC [Anaerolineae bacterium]
MLVLGLDPGTATTGYGLVREHDDGALQAIAYGVITTPAGLAMPLRLKQLYTELSALIAQHQPDAAAVEQIFFSKNITTGISVAQARGVLLLALADAGLRISEYKPNEIKQAIAGYGSAPKAQMQEMVRALLMLEDIPRPDDAADALAVAITDINTNQYERLLAE